MRIAYFVNQYPKVSHTFIRREIAALEAQGVEVARYSLRALADELVDADDVAELARTRVILQAGVLAFMRATFGLALRRPKAFASALRAALRLGGPARQRLKHLVYLAEACVLASELEQAGIHHVHAHFGTNSAAVVMLCRLLGGPGYSFTVHGPEEFDMPLSLSLAEKMAHARFVVAISSFCRSQLYRWADPRIWDRIHVVRCALEPAHFEQPAAPIPERTRLLCVGRLSAEKAQLLLLDALRDVLDRGHDVELTLAGDGPLRPTIEARIAELGLQGRVSITGWISNAAVREAMQQAKAIVLASFAEGLPVVLMEALAQRRPVVTTYVAGIPELVEPGRSGWLVPAGDRQALAEALAAVATARPEQLQQMAEAGYARARERHHMPTEAARLKALFASAGG